VLASEKLIKTTITMAKTFFMVLTCTLFSDGGLMNPKEMSRNRNRHTPRAQRWLQSESSAMNCFGPFLLQKVFQHLFKT
jgi:hypothetical protein